MRSDDLPLSRAAVDRDAHARTRPQLIDELLAAASTRVLHVIGGQVVITSGAEPALLLTAPAGTIAPVPTAPVGGQALAAYLGRDEQLAYLVQIYPQAAGIDDQSSEGARRSDDPQGLPGGQLSQLRDIGWDLSDRDAGLATEAVALANWHATHLRCPRCGAGTRVTDAGWVRYCPHCDGHHFPRTDPAVIMAIVDERDRLLLGHAATWPARRYSVPAGFVEPGEHLEAAVRREVAEETGVQVGQVDYRGSQPWPFPASLMVGFRGVALSTEVTPDGEEITAAQFVTRAQLRDQIAAGQLLLPRATSIAHHLIREWYGRPLPQPPGS